jgi:DNA-binding NarL/FixJ family response regulator
MMAVRESLIKPPVRVLLADRHALIRAGLRALLSVRFQVVEEVADQGLLLSTIQRLQPDVAVVDIELWERPQQVKELAECVRVSGEAVKVLVTGTVDSGEDVGQILSLGVAGYVSKSRSVSEFYQSIETIMDGGVFVSSALGAEGAARLPATAVLLDRLSVRQRSVLVLIAEGFNVKEIGAKLRISPKTVESHRAKLMERLEIHDIAGLVRLAVRGGLVGP